MISFIPIIILLLIIKYSYENDDPLPVVMWHGMGDSCCNPLSLGRINKIIMKNMHNDTYVKSIQIGNNMIEDIEYSFSMNVNLQIQDVCKQISKDKKLRKGYNAIGFSQGSQFLRAVAQRCPTPPINNLISIGGQHQGIFGLPHCFYPKLKVCDYLRKLLNHGAYWSWVQDKFVQAEYWHDPLNEQQYIEKSIFLADINNEREINYEYRKNLISLKNFVLVMFENDGMVLPKESAWFSFYTPGQDVNITKLEDSVIYQEDKLGLRRLNEEGKLHFISLPGYHLQFTEDWFIKEIIQKFL